MDLLAPPIAMARFVAVTVLAVVALVTSAWWMAPKGADDSPLPPSREPRLASTRSTETTNVELPWAADALLLAIERLPLVGASVQQIHVDWDSRGVRVDLIAQDVAGLHAAVAALNEGSQGAHGRWALMAIAAPDGPQAPQGMRARIEWQRAPSVNADGPAVTR